MTSVTSKQIHSAKFVFLKFSSRSLLSVSTMSYQVFSSRLDKRKSWYAVNEGTFGPAFRKYGENMFFRLFPEEIQKVSYHDLTSSNGDPPDPEWFALKYKNRDVLVTSTLDLCGGLLRQKELGDKSYLTSASFKRIGEVINSCCAITGLPRDGMNFQNTAIGDCVKKTMVDLMQHFQRQEHLLQQDLEEDKETRSLRRKKKRLSKKSAGNILRTLEGVCDWQKASVASVLGHLCAHDPAKEPSEAHNIVSEIVTAVTDKNGVKRGLESLVPDVLQQYMKLFRVPDWILPYFTLEAKIPDKGWQTMINLTKLGRTGVGLISDKCIHVYTGPIEWWVE